MEIIIKYHYQFLRGEIKRQEPIVIWRLILYNPTGLWGVIRL
jgi:hypothetical protein